MNDEIKKGLEGFDQFVKDRFNQIESKIKKICKDLTIVKCPVCFQETMVLGDNPNCLFCYHTGDPKAIANEVTERTNFDKRSILGIYEK